MRLSLIPCTTSCRRNLCVQHGEMISMSLPKYDVLVGGKWQPSASGEYFETDNPFTGATWALIPRCGEADANQAVAAAKAAFDRGACPAMTATQRGALLRRLGDLLAEHA